MGKKKIWNVGCALYLFLLVCTLLSMEIQKIMIIEVNVTQGKNLSDREKSFPIEALDETGEAFYCAVKRKENFREEYVVEKKNISIIREENGNIVIAGNIFYDDEGKSPLVIYHATHALEEGNVVTLSEIMLENEEEMQYVQEKFEEQKVLLLCGIPVMIISFLILVISWTQLCMLYDRNWKKGLFGFLLLVFVVLICKGYLGCLDIPRQILPKESIFDIEYYNTILGKYQR